MQEQLRGSGVTGGTAMTRRFKVVVQKSDEGYIAYPLGLKGVVVADGETFEETLRNVQSAIAFHMETFGEEVLAEAVEPQDVYLAETEVTVNA
jgi:predicted RNase H-like HicB family nuclease